jgi:hypothetical protein
LRRKRDERVPATDAIVGRVRPIPHELSAFRLLDVDCVVARAAERALRAQQFAFGCGLHFCVILLVFSDISGAVAFAIVRVAAYRAARVRSHRLTPVSD